MTLSDDIVWLAMNSARQKASEAGVSEAEFTRVCRKMTGYWSKKKASNPLASLF